MGGIHPLDAVTERRPARLQPDDKGEGRSARPPLPFLVELRLVGLDVDRTEPVHPPEVVDSVHAATFARIEAMLSGWR